MTEQEKKARIAELRAELKELQATPRSDWHAGFEALLRIDTFHYADRVHIRTEEEIGVMPPRTDFLVLVEDEKVEFEKEIFRAFRRINIIEYKGEGDSLNERVIRKVCGYANLYIGSAEHEGERTADEVTLSIFRSTRNPELFNEMMEVGTLEEGNTPGIYFVKGLVDLPFQIVITGELQGDEYAAYRALTDKAAEKDVELIITDVKSEHNDILLEYYRGLLKLIITKNPEYINIGRGDSEMEDILLEMVRDRVEEEKDAKATEVTVLHIQDIMSKLSYSEEQAMDLLNIPASQREIYARLVGNSVQ